MDKYTKCAIIGAVGALSFNACINAYQYANAVDAKLFREQYRTIVRRLRFLNNFVCSAILYNVIAIPTGIAIGYTWQLSLPMLLITSCYLNRDEL